MDPISLAIAGVGLGLSIFGGMSQSKVAGEEASVSENEAQQEQGINNVKQQQMELQGRRQSMENIRNTQQARAMAVAGATSGGAQFGSGLAGGLAQVTDQGLFNQVGVNSALQSGRQIAGFNQNITNDKMQMAALGGTMATDQGITSLGGAFMKAGPMVGPAISSAGGFLKNSNFGNMFMGGGSPTGLT
jgi:hypothetical protein